MKGFRVSSKTGENVDEAMTYFIKFIIKRTELINCEKKSISLEQNNSNNYYKMKKKNNCV